MFIFHLIKKENNNHNNNNKFDNDPINHLKYFDESHENEFQKFWTGFIILLKYEVCI